MTGAGSGGQGPPDGSDAEEAEKCPICLGVLAGGELAMPDSCCHVFCLRCLLTWAELQMCPSCPVDRRPFTNVYRWDGNLSLVQVPVRKQLSQAEVESCCCGNPEKQICVNRKSVRRSKRQKTERKADGKTKGLVRKCNDEDPSSLSRKKVRGAECCAWSPPPCVALTTSPVDIADPVWLAADMPCEPELKQCRPQVQHCPWLSPAAPIPADGTSRQRFHEPTWNNSPLPLELTSSPFPSSSSFIPSHFVFQGVVVCAVTRPKGGEKRGGRSTSKAPAKEQESLPSRRSGRNSKSQEEAPPSDATSPPQSSPSDSDSAASQSTKSGKTPQVPAKRKGKRVTNRKASGKRKAAVKKAPSPEVVSSPAASEEEDEGEGEDNGKKVEPEEEPQQEEQQHSDAEEEEQSRLNSGPGSVNSTEDDGDDAQEQSGDQQKRDDGGEESGDLAGPMDSPPDSPLSCSDGVESKSEEEPASPPPPGDEDEEEEEEKRPSLSPSDSWREDPASPPSPEQDDPNVTMDTSTEPGDAGDDQPSEEEKTEDTSVEKPASPGAVESLEDQADLGANARQDADVKVPGSEEHSPAGSSDDGASKEDGVASKDDTAESRKDNGTDPFQDNTDVVPMDCSSPMSEPGDESPPERPSEGASRAAAEPAAAAAEPQVAGAAATDQQERERSQERKNGKRRSRFHSPTRTWSPKKEGKKEASPSPRSRSRDRDGSGGPAPGRSSRARSRERDGDRDGDRDHSRRERSRERRRRHRSRSKSKSKSRSKSRSRSRSRTRSHRRGPSPERRGSRERSRERSPQRKERRGGWRSGGGGGGGGGSGFEGRRFQGGGGRFENGVPKESSPERQGWSDNPDWVTEKTRGKTESRNSDSGFGGASRWEDKSGGNGGEPRGRGGRGGYEPSRGAAWGAASRSFYGQQDDAADSRWPRSNSGTGGNSGTDAYSRFNENRGGGRKKDSDPGDMLDRSGWSSASSWAVRRTLPADVQDYYSKRERGGAGSWNRQEEETQPADPAKGELPPQAVPGNAPVPVLNMIPPQPPQMNVLQHHFPMQAMQGALPVSLQPAAPYAMPPPVPLHLHPSVPLLQVPVVGAQGLPPPPPPPPPMQAGSQAAAQPDGQTTQMTNTVMGLGKPSFLPTPTKAGVAAASQSQAASSQALPSSTTQPGQHHRAQADSSKKEKKVQIQELAVNEVKTAIKPYYQKKEITKEEYKEIVRKAVEKVCHSKSGEVNSSKVANLVKAYVDKYKHARKK